MFKNWKNLKIKETIWINLLRTFSAGVLFMVITFILRPPDMPLLAPLAFPFFFPIIFLAFFVVAQVLRVFKLGGVGQIMCMLFSVPGDPLMYILHNIKPHLVPVKEYSFFMLNSIILVYEDRIDEIEETHTYNSERSAECPFSGSILADKEGSVLGFSWPYKETIFTIDSEWNVKRDSINWGWIDNDGQIRKGIKSNPGETLSPGKIVGKIQNDLFFIDGVKYGSLIK